MARDYEKESAWRKKKYIRLVADVDAELGARFKEKLAADNLTYADWLREKIKETLHEGRSK